MTHEVVHKFATRCYCHSAARHTRCTAAALHVTHGVASRALLREALHAITACWCRRMSVLQIGVFTFQTCVTIKSDGLIRCPADWAALAFCSPQLQRRQALDVCTFDIIADWSQWRLFYRKVKRSNHMH